MTYNRFIQGLKAAEVEVDRRMLAELAVNDAAAFTALVELARAQRRRPGRGRRRLTRPSGPRVPDVMKPPQSARHAAAASRRRPSVLTQRRAPIRGPSGCAALTRRAGSVASGPGGSSPRGRRRSARRSPRTAAEPVPWSSTSYADADAAHADGPSSCRGRARGCTSTAVTDEVLAAMSDTVTPQGLVAVCRLLDGPLRRASLDAGAAAGPGRRARRTSATPATPAR